MFSQVNAVERTPSMSELNEMLLGQVTCYLVHTFLLFKKLVFCKTLT